jgi:hypothetical protein
VLAHLTCRHTDDLAVATQLGERDVGIDEAVRGELLEHERDALDRRAEVRLDPLTKGCEPWRLGLQVRDPVEHGPHRAEEGGLVVSAGVWHPVSLGFSGVVRTDPPGDPRRADPIADSSWGADPERMALQLVDNPDRPTSRWTWESARGHTRAVRISPHVQALLVTLSLWRDDRCVGSLRLTPAEVTSLIVELTAALADMATASVADQHEEMEPVDLAGRVAELEARLAALERPDEA